VIGDLAEYYGSGSPQFLLVNVQGQGSLAISSFGTVVAGPTVAVTGADGPLTTVIEAQGSTSLVQVANAYFLYPVGGSSGPPLSYNGALVTVGEFGAWTPIGAEQTASGYEVAWKVTGADQYSVWDTDSSGNVLSNPTGVVSGSSAALQSLEPSFHQDLNTDGTIGLPTTVIEAQGSTSLVQVGNEYFLYPVGGSSGPALSYNGAHVTVGEFGSWMPIGAEKTASGYEVAWKVTGADQYSVWDTDSSGNVLSNSTGVVSGSSAALQSLEPSFHQDLNTDGRIGPPPATGTGSSGTASLALLTNYMASTFATQAGEGTGAVTGAQLSGQDFLTKPAA
jgi:serralysin